ncbi:MAG: D-alanyl-D-alanine carboxypeptidase family protein [Pseudomonadota bacterium]|nr:D-alanyl-D-alanine carboxypeptidase family protein [Pseudomonadota bacterium]MED5422801.1 D-alanyl-D-alanine carboxypeptidase family protein [Pseudomonadota bacterium]
MTHITKLFSSLFIIVLSLTMVTFPIASADAKGNPKYASIVIDADTGAILSQRYADKKLHPASLTKVMTLMLTFDAIKAGKVSLYDRVVISPYAASMVPSKLGLKPGETIRVKDAIYILVTKSANDIAVALAEHLGGTEYSFAKMMTSKARSIGMGSTTFKNASGLHHSRQVSTARDMARMGRYLVNNYQSYYHYFSKKTFRYRGVTYRNHNKLMLTYKGMDGLKTGYTAKSGFNLIASATRDGNRVIGVVFGGRSGKTRNNHMKDILDRGFLKMEKLHLAQLRNMPLPKRKPAAVYAALNNNNASSSNAISPATGLMQTASADAGTAQSLWSVQIGAFKSRVKVDNLLQDAVKVLPNDLNGAYPIIAPLRTASSGWMFRARLAGLTLSQAESACNYFRDCLIVAPRR